MSVFEKVIRINDQSLPVSLDESTTVRDFLEWLHQSAFFGSDQEQWSSIRLDGQEYLIEQDALEEETLNQKLNAFEVVEVFAESGAVSEPLAKESLTPPLAPHEVLKNTFKQRGSARDLAYESLTDLYQYCPYLYDLCLRAAEATNKVDFFQAFLKIIEGVSIFTETMQHAKSILRVAHLSEIGVLEADLLSILKDLQSCYSSHETRAMQELIRDHLAVNIKDWYEVGIPFLQKIQDC